MTDHVVFTGGVPGAELPAHHAMADVFAMPCRTRGAGLDVEGLGIVFLEASADRGAGGRRRIGRRPGDGAATARPAVVVDGRLGRTRSPTAVGELLADPRPGGRDGRRRPAVGEAQWQLGTLAARLASCCAADTC